MCYFAYLFWGLAALIFYVYFGYPLLLLLATPFLTKEIKKKEIFPKISVVIVARNEEASIRETLLSKIDQDYPKDRIEIVVASDSSTDQTDEIVLEFAARYPEIPIRLVRQEMWLGKTAALNLAVAASTGEILVFSDANSCYLQGAIRKLVRNFNDPKVGYVTGQMIYGVRQGNVVAEGCGFFMRYENRLRKLETSIGSIVGVDGGIDAMRRCLFEPIRADLISDFMLPLKVASRGYRVVYEEEAVNQEEALHDSRKEFRMRVRVIVRSFNAIVSQASLLNPFKHGFFSIQLLTHKILRYLVPEFMILLYVANIPLAWIDSRYRWLIAGQTLFYGMASLGPMWSSQKSRRSFLIAPYYFCLINAAAFWGLMRYLAGERQVTWTPRVGKS